MSLAQIYEELIKLQDELEEKQSFWNHKYENDPSEYNESMHHNITQCINSLEDAVEALSE